jgi:hypothetical protein
MILYGKEKVYGSMIRNDAAFPRPIQSERGNFLEVGTGISRDTGAVTAAPRRRRAAAARSG